jgi:trk system potassium uptake protein TrkH
MEESGNVILSCGAVTMVSGVFLRIFGTEDVQKLTSKRESFLAVTLIWIVLSVFGMLPFYMSGSIPKVSDAFFETMSGFSTTGSTILRHIDEMPKGLLLWRSITQWIGGIGIIVFALVLLPIVGGNGVSLYNSEVSGIAKDKFSPKIKQTAKRLWIIYLIISALLICLLWAGPMSMFDAVCHGLTTVSTGGYSTKQASIAYWNSPYTEYVLCLFMFIGGTNFTLIFFLLKGNFKRVVRDEEFRWYVIVCIVFSAIVMIGLMSSGQLKGVSESFRSSLFQVVSVVTTTGFSTVDFNSWGVFYSLIMCLLMLFCACAGSTSGGLKMVRMVILSKNAINEFKRQVHPNAVLPVRLNGNVIPMEVVTKILAFIFLYLLILFVSFLVLGLSGMNFEESVSSAITCMSNVGPALGSLGPNGHFADIPDVSKWYLSFLMLVGRLEIFTVLSLFMPAFWKK